MKSKKNKGQTLVEYGLIIALLGVLLISSLSFMRNAISNTFSKSASELEDVSAGSINN
ncbi:MAG: Flp family type IVb pilin [Candidatus Methylacidiphilales bacterium]